MREMLERSIEFFKARPEKASRTYGVTCTLVGPTETRNTSEDHIVVADEPAYAGGTDAGPSPVGLTLVSLASCAAVAFRYWSELLDVSFDSLRIEVDGDIDLRGGFGFDGVRSGFTDVRLTVHVTGPADADQYEKVFRQATSLCPVGDMLKNPVNVISKLQLA